MKVCKKCSTELVGSFCHNCGFPEEQRRIDGKYVFSEISSVLNFDKGILFTIRELLIRPGMSIQHFIHEDRNRLVKPILFLLLSSLVYSLVQGFAGFHDGYMNYSFDEEKQLVVSQLFMWVSDNYGYSNVIMAFFIALWIKLLFRKYDYNYFEIIILLCFIMGVMMLIYTVFGVLESITGLSLLQFGAILGFFYSSWAIGQFFNKKKFTSFLKGLVSYLLGIITFTIVVLGIGLFIDKAL